MQVIEFDRDNVNTLWWDAVFQDMKDLCPVFDPWEKLEDDIPPGYKEIKCHLIFNINMGKKFSGKGCFVPGGHMTDTPTTLTYISIVSRDLAHIALTVADLNGVYIFSCDIKEPYLTFDRQENIWTCAGPELGSEAGTIMIVKMALYGLKCLIQMRTKHLRP